MLNSIFEPFTESVQKYIWLALYLDFVSCNLAKCAYSTFSLIPYNFLHIVSCHLRIV